MITLPFSSVIPVQAGIHALGFGRQLDSRLRGNDRMYLCKVL